MNLLVVPRSWDNLQVNISCPVCRKTVPLFSPGGNTVALPLICEHCDHHFRPQFYCPDRKSPRYHVFEAENLYLDNLHSLYAFCPEHTYTSYDLVQDVPPVSRGFTQVRVRFMGFLRSRLFRLALLLESARQRLFPIHLPPHSTPSSTGKPKSISATRGSRAKFLEILRKAPNIEPEKFDTL